MGKDLYSVLDVDPETNKAEIRQAYVQLVRQYHPDVSKDPHARERFEEITLAYNVLYDDETRIYYNLYYRDALNFSCYQELWPWWQQYSLALSLSILTLGVFMLMGLLIWLLA